MTQQGPPPAGGLGEEAVKLLQAIQEWTRETNSGDSGRRVPGGLLSDLNEHIATGGKDCQYCPVCQLIAAVRTMSPEVKSHLGTAASSLLQAASGILATQSGDARRGGGFVERIDLDGDDWEDEDS